MDNRLSKIDGPGCFRRLTAFLLAALVVLTLNAPVWSATLDAYETGLSLYGQGYYTGAFAYFLQASRKDAGNVDARYYLADTLVRMGRRKEARDEYQKILELAPTSQAARLSVIALARLRNADDESGRRLWRLSGQNSAQKVDRYVGFIGEGDTYLDRVGESSGFTRWSLLTGPLKVYIESSPVGIRNFQPSFINQVRRALDVWMGVLDHQLSYTLQNMPDDADIRVSWTNALDTRGHSGDGGTSYTAGLTTPTVRDNQLQSMTVSLATFDIMGKPQNDDVMYAVAVHEMGHALGLLGHSDHEEDIMFAHNQNVVRPSARDIRTIRRLYATRVAVDNRPPSQRGSDPSPTDSETARQDQMKKMDAAIARLEAQSRQEDTSLTWLNLGVAYFQKALRLEGDASTPTDKKTGFAGDETPIVYYHKALTAMTKSIALEPDAARAYHRRSLVHQALKDYPSALSDIQAALTRDRRVPEYYMLQAWYMAQLGRKAESQDSLNTYLLYKPGEANSSDVRQIREALKR